MSVLHVVAHHPGKYRNVSTLIHLNGQIAPCGAKIDTIRLPACTGGLIHFDPAAEQISRTGDADTVLAITLRRGDAATVCD